MYLKCLRVNNITCHASATMVRKENSIEFFTNFKFNKGNGVVSLSGTTYHDGMKDGFISETVLFDYDYQSGSYFMKSKKIYRSPQMNLPDHVGKSWLPDFYRKPDNDIVMKIEEIYPKKWIFISETIPLFFCEG